MDTLVYKEINVGELYFSLKCKSDAIIFLSVVPEHQLPSPEDNLAYEINIGCKDNTETTIKLKDSSYVTVNTPNILNELETKHFWIKWGAGFISVGKSSEKDPFIKCPYKNIKHIYCLGFQSLFDAEWTILKPPDYRTKIKSITSGPCKDGLLQNVEMNFGVIHLNVFGPKFTIKFCACLNNTTLKELYEVEISSFSSCIIRNQTINDPENYVVEYFSPEIKQKICGMMKSQELVGFWFCWFDKCLSMGIEDSINKPLLTSKISPTDFHLNHIGKMSKWSKSGFSEVFSTKWHGVRYPTDGVPHLSIKESRQRESEIEQFRFNFERPSWVGIDKMDLKHYVCSATFGLVVNFSGDTIEQLTTLQNDHCDQVLNVIAKNYDKPRYTLGLTLIHYYVKSAKLLSLLLRIYCDEGVVCFIDLASATFYKEFQTYINHVMLLRARNPRQISQADSIHYPPNGIFLDTTALVCCDFSNVDFFSSSALPNLNNPKSREDAFFSVQKHTVSPRFFRTWFPEIDNTTPDLSLVSYKRYIEGLVTNFILLGGKKNDTSHLAALVDTYILPYKAELLLQLDAVKKCKVFENYNITYLSCLKYVIPKTHVLTNPYMNAQVILIRMSYARLYVSYFYNFPKFPDRFVALASDVMAFLLSEIKSLSNSLNLQVLCTVKGLDVKCDHPVKKNVFFNVMLNFTMRLAEITGEPLFVYYHYFNELLSKFLLVVDEVTSRLNTVKSLRLVEFCADWVVEKINDIVTKYNDAKLLVTEVCGDFDETEFNQTFSSTYNLKGCSHGSMIDNVFDTTISNPTSLIEDYKTGSVYSTHRIFQGLEPNSSASFMYKAPFKSGIHVYRGVASKKFPSIDFSNHSVFKRYDSENMVCLWSKNGICDYPLILFKYEKMGIYEYGLAMFIKTIVDHSTT
ncbi:uncharacterized protein LOC126846305 [Adelges cooleyi]|uniref:uncharacterized protein LOC126846305 n=1 Tax=Adelges cooleyi TaxID=133065 RepID=UPI00218078D0|nr:uncharacterized protein LOC126846305 [Adelges cooleyi]XP_050441570.1 uncharacterized protein LOC126846305 [Adelges cooleyi]